MLATIDRTRGIDIGTQQMEYILWAMTCRAFVLGETQTFSIPTTTTPLWSNQYLLICVYFLLIPTGIIIQLHRSYWWFLNSLNFEYAYLIVASRVTIQ